MTDCNEESSEDEDDVLLKIYDLIDMIKEVDQNISCKLAFGADLKSVFNLDEETPIINHLFKGFKVESKVTLVSNLMKAISEMLKSDLEAEQKMGQKMLMFVPIFLFKINANVNIKLDDVKDITDLLPEFGKLTFKEETFEDLLHLLQKFEYGLHAEYHDCDDDDNLKDIKAEFALYNGIIESICNLDKDSYNNNVSIKCSSADFPIGFDLDCHSEGLGRVIKLFMKEAMLKEWLKQRLNGFEDDFYISKW